MKRLSVLLALILMPAAPVAFADGPAAGEVNAIVERIRKVGAVCVEGDACAAGATAAVAAPAGAAAGGVEGRYNATCGTCHLAGVGGAPKLGDTEAWAPRLAKGMDVLYESGIAGLAPAMPARGLCMDCSDDEIRAIVDYMVDTVR